MTTETLRQGALKSIEISALPPASMTHETVSGICKWESSKQTPGIVGPFSGERKWNLHLKGSWSHLLASSEAL
jgi:hypothetical protein